MTWFYLSPVISWKRINKIGFHIFRPVDINDPAQKKLIVDKKFEDQHSAFVRILLNKVNELMIYCFRDCFDSFIKNNFENVESISIGELRHDLIYLAREKRFATDRFIIFLLKAISEQWFALGGLGGFQINNKEIIHLLKTTSFAKRIVGTEDIPRAWSSFIIKNRIEFDYLDQCYFYGIFAAQDMLAHAASICEHLVDNSSFEENDPGSYCYTIMDLARFYKSLKNYEKAGYFYQTYIYRYEKHGIPEHIDNQYIDAVIELAEIKGLPDYQINLIKTVVEELHRRVKRVEHREREKIEYKNETDIEAFVSNRETAIWNNINKLDLQTVLISPKTPFTNKIAIINVLELCNEYIYWIDKYFSKTGLTLLNLSEKNNIKEIKIIMMSDNINEDFRTLFKDFKKEMSNIGLICELRVITESKIGASVHDRFIISKDNAFNVPSADIIVRGQLSEISKSDNKEKLFKEFQFLWQNSKDLIHDWNKIKDKLNIS